MFQSNAADNMKLYGELEMYFVAMSRQILAPAILRHNSTEQLCDLDVSSGFYLLPVNATDMVANFQHKLNIRAYFKTISSM